MLKIGLCCVLNNSFKDVNVLIFKFVIMVFYVIKGILKVRLNEGF